ncbi:MAG TPA: LptF/LptG family permease [Gemmatimonadaceae bacterium]|nr:LptF/LptG family permease [Gemmatimonadaceae bacterium]
MKIISRYVLKEHFGPFTFALTALTSLMLLQYIARQFGNLVGKGLRWQVIAEFFVLSIPFTVAMTLPMAVLVAVLYAFSRLASENEITALKAGGVSMRQLLIPSLSLAFVLALVMLGFNDQILPRANHRLAVLQMDIFRAKPTFALREQVLNTIKEGQLYLRANHLDEGSSRMRDVTIYDVANPVNRRTITADSGKIELAPNQRDLQMTLYHGLMETVPTDKPGQLTRLYYMRQLMRVAGVASQFQETGNADTVSKGDREMSVCEMQAALAKADTGLQRARFDSVEAQWERDSIVAAMRPVASATVKAIPQPKPPAGPHPKAPMYKTPFGVGGAYCGLLAGVGRVVSGGPRPAAAATARPLPPSAGISPSAGGMAGLPADQRINLAKLNADQSRLLRNRYDVEIQKKFSLAAACLIFVLVGAPVALRFPRGGVGLVIGVSLFIFAVYYVGLIGGEALSDRGIISPFWAMWATNVIMTVVGLVMTLRMGREATTGRGGDFGEMLETARMWFARVGRKAGLPLERRRRMA